MTKLAILEYPDPRLRTRAEPVTVFDAELAQLSENMLETMYAAPGIGLAATQVNVHRRILVADVSPDNDSPQVMVNPEILNSEGTEVMEEGCLSVPGVFDEVERAERIRVRAQDVTGKPFQMEVDGLLAVCIQHEIDHLNGKLFVDYLSELKRTKIRKKLDKERRERAADASSGRPQQQPAP